MAVEGNGPFLYMSPALSSNRPGIRGPPTSPSAVQPSRRLDARCFAACDPALIGCVADNPRIDRQIRAETANAYAGINSTRWVKELRLLDSVYDWGKSRKGYGRIQAGSPDSHNSGYLRRLEDLVACSMTGTPSIDMG
ncbi:hypothetical protein BP6252_04874 [Coleophoma cylindrospora]|uniref:Uncharacterized protein n=1 Tax=Coleophoma cylindrospora TaxID=1849047 RepID=A0A3D8S1V8_9HELO|nr:hypothetical protein BP6252_04874 [Coleophoma cylindrospora]